MPTLRNIIPHDPPRGLRVGLLGGSFNPAHEGHVHISTLALDRLRLDQVWWLVSPQNPLKATDGMAALADRLDGAHSAAIDERIRVDDIERDLGTRFTADTLAALKKRFPGVRFVWIMGADNLIQMPQWKRWKRVFRSVPIAVFARPSYSLGAVSGLAARKFAKAEMKASSAPRLANARPPAWVYLKTPLNRASATRIRAGAAQSQPK
ncbi:MAG: nicotinate-nucleotide adenylyltransferase [Rhodospirillales bacterium]|nr:nicotinate-nucleotide adenylyltransferase [Rhodospirillales bacterium]